MKIMELSNIARDAPSLILGKRVGDLPVVYCVPYFQARSMTQGRATDPSNRVIGALSARL
jgi:hypothetical protein